MKNCVYLVQNRQTGKWYIGSHKNSDNIRNRGYMGSGTDIKEAQENEGIENFHIEVIVDFLETRQQAYDIEGQILDQIDAKKDPNSYNRKNSDDNSKSGGFLGLFRKPKKLNPAQLNNILSRVGKDPVGPDDINGGDVSTVKKNWESLIEGESAIVGENAYKKGHNAAKVVDLDNDFEIIKTKLVVWLEQAIADENNRHESIKAKLEAAGDISIPEIEKAKLDSGLKLDYLKDEFGKIENEAGRFKMLKAIFTERYREGVKDSLISGL